MNNIYGIYGASGFGKEVLPLIKKYLKNNDEIFFIDDSNNLETLQGHKVISFEEFISIDTSNLYISIAIANSHIRTQITAKCEAHNIKIINIKSENALLLDTDSISIENGSILCPFVTLTANIKIGKGFHANIYSYVAHDCIIGDYVTFAPAVKCNGNVHIEDHVYIGTGVIIHQGKPNKPLTIGKGATIAAGSVVTKSIPAGMTVFGNPAIEFTKENMKRRR